MSKKNKTKTQNVEVSELKDMKQLEEINGLQGFFRVANPENVLSPDEVMTEEVSDEAIIDEVLNQPKKNNCKP